MAAAALARVEWPPVVSSWRWARERRAVVAAGDRDPPGRGPDVPARSPRSSPRPTRPPTCTPRPRATSRRSGRSTPASGSAGSRRSSTTLEWDLPFAKWFVGGELNVTYNCVDRHVERGLGDKVAYHWIGEPGDTRTITYARPPAPRSNRAANALKELGVQKGDRVAIYMPMIPELPIAMLACARLGAPHTVVFGGFSAEALGDRINDAQAKVLITADGGWRRGKKVGLKHHADEARRRARPSIEHVLVVNRLRDGCHMVEGRDHWWDELVEPPARPSAIPVPVESEHMLYLLYTSGTTAKPKGIIHTTRRLPARHELHPRDRLRRQARRRVLVRRRHRLGDRPQLHRLRAAGQRHDRDHVRGRARHAGLGPLVADRRGLQGHDPVLRADRHPGVHEAGRGSIPARHDLSLAARSSARSASRSTPRPGSGTTSTSAAADAPIVDTWWQTETGAILISPLPGVTTTKPGSATFPLPGIAADVVDGDGRERPARVAAATSS